MSKGNSPIKVLKTALKRVQKGWTQGVWTITDSKTGQTFVCLEGALFGYCNADRHGLTTAQRKARDVTLSIIKERHDGFWSIPDFNDAPGRTQDEVQEIVKLAIIRLETGGDDEASTDEDFDNLLDFMDIKEG